jgi:serine/threonine protein kinase
VKAANMLITKDGLVKIADFGIATHLADLSTNEEVEGSPYWSML